MELITTAVAAVLAGIDPDTLRYHANEGNVLTIRVERGNGEYQRLFIREDIERFVLKRQHQRQERKRGRPPKLVGAARVVPATPADEEAGEAALACADIADIPMVQAVTP
jgi:hypothetical protein